MLQRRWLEANNLRQSSNTRGIQRSNSYEMSLTRDGPLLLVPPVFPRLTVNPSLLHLAEAFKCTRCLPDCLAR